MRKLFLFISLFLVGFIHPSWGQEYAFNGIPDSLISGAHAVIRSSIMEVTIDEKQEYKYRIEMAVTVLDKTGEEEGDITLLTALNETVQLLYGRIYDSRGVQIKSVDVTNFQADRLISTGTNINENRDLYQMEMRAKSYPYTSVYAYEHKVNGSLNLPDWRPLSNTYVSCMYGKVSIKLKNGIGVHFKADSKLKELPIEINKKSKIQAWEISSIKAVKKQPELLQSPMLRMAMDDFEIKGNAGSMRSWIDFGNFIFNLNETQYEMNDELKKTIHELADKYENPNEKISALYSYLQEEYRYVLVHFGMGGWQPQSCTYTFNKGFGDCKALTLFMQTMLKEVGIEAYYCLVQAGDDLEAIDPDFAENRFNHAIVCAIVDGKNVWIECTSKKLKAGNLGEFSGNKYALIIDKNKSRLIKTSIGIKEE
ncbi:MAG TPA: transglutaminase-like domain-containing protein [Flavobacteriales bacterium]|nr:transglutaminase-like domain-containing protein [Flavobacteriales bacterium]